MRKNSMVLIIVSVLFVVNVGVVMAKDIFISPVGNDLISYVDNNINNSWKSIAKAFTSVKPKDNVFFREGDYFISSTINTIENINPASEYERVRFSNYGNEAVHFISSIHDAIYIDKDYYEINGISFTAPGTFWLIAKTNDAKYFKMTNCQGTVSVEGGSLNFGCVRFKASRGNYGRVENCIFYGPGGGGNQNTAGVLIHSAQGIKVVNCEFYNIPQAIYYKHTSIASDTGIEFAYNYFYNNGYAIANAAQYSDIHDNVFVNGGVLLGLDGGTGDDGDKAGSDHNNIHHNTFYNCTIKLVWSSSNDASGAQYNIIKDNIFTKIAEVFWWVASDHPHYSIMDYNLYCPDTSVGNYNKGYSLDFWKSYYGQDEHSLSGVPEFVGGTSLSNIIDYTLTTTSLGYKSASNGVNVGAYVQSVGVQSVGSPTPVKEFKAQ